MKTIYLGICLLLVNPLCFAATSQSLQLIQDQVNSFVKSALNPEGDYQISGAQIDPRLTLPACGENLEIFIQSGELKAGRNTVGIRCNGSNAWTIFSTILIKEFRRVLVSNQQLNRNDTVSSQQLTSEVRDIASLQQGYLSNPEEIINKQATRFIPSGSVLYGVNFTEPAMIKRGERVSIQTGKPGLLITSTGIAMMDGIKGQQISVKNITSKRVIQATVKTPGVVAVYF